MPPESDPRTTDDKFVMEIKTSDNSHVSEKNLSKLIKDGFVELKKKYIMIKVNILLFRYSIAVLFISVAFHVSSIRFSWV